MAKKQVPDPEWLNRRLIGQIIKSEPDQTDFKKIIKLHLALQLTGAEDLLSAFPAYVKSGLNLAKNRAELAPRRMVVLSPSLSVALEVTNYSQSKFGMSCEKCELKPGVVFRSKGVEVIEQDAVIQLDVPYKDTWQKFLADHLKGPLVRIKLTSANGTQSDITRKPAAKKRAKTNRVKRKSELHRGRAGRR